MDTALSPPGTAPEAPPAAWRVLYAEDDGTSSLIVRRTLERLGCAVEVAATAAEWARALEAGPPHLALVDLTLPDASGLDILRKLRAAHPGVPALILTGSNDVQDAVAAMKAGATDYLSKPVDPQRLTVSVQNALTLSRQQEEIDRLLRESGRRKPKTDVDLLLKELVEKGGSDLHLKTGRPPLLRIAGDLVPTDRPEVDATDMQTILQTVLGPHGFRGLTEEHERDAAYTVRGLARFRVNAFMRLGELGAIFRAIPLATPTLEGLGLPEVLKEICKAPQGLVLVTGPTGSGKSTTLAAMIEHINRTEPLHVVTIEDPVEFLYTDKKCEINQRQLGSDVRSVTEALRRALRQDPDVILVGEMRDRETMELAIHAAETGHLVFSTLHTNDAKQSLDRILDTFPADAARQVRSLLSLTLKAVISQRLVRRADGRGRTAALEVMIASPQIRELIAEGKIREIDKAIREGGDFYRMQSFNQSLAGLVGAKVVTEEEALATSSNPGDLQLLLRGFTNGSATVTNSPPSTPAVTTRHFPAPSTPAPFSSTMKISRGF